MTVKHENSFAAEAIAGMKQIIRLYNSKDILGSTNEALVPLKTIEVNLFLLNLFFNIWTVLEPSIDFISNSQGSPG